ncbi:MAG: Ig-like domain-containing protein [Verrucomicrobia bacterium]|nr:Ig-like domain-containing protein [Verrucomicrobiota bacterium]
MDGDGVLDVVTANFDSDDISIMRGDGEGGLEGAVTYPSGNGSISVVVGDWDSDGLKDMAAANHYADDVVIMLGNDVEALAEDPEGRGIRTGTGYGNITDREDYDYWSFSAHAGDMLSVAVESRGETYYKGLYYRVLRPDGGQLVTFYSNYRNGIGESAPVELPMDGTYRVVVRYNYDYFDEYRIRVTTATPPMQMESEGNDNTGNADTVSRQETAGRQKGTVLGYISNSDGNGDYFAFGNITAGTTLSLNLDKPGSSELTAILSIYDADGVVSSAAAGMTNLEHTIPSGSDGAYYARVQAAEDTAGLMSQYILELEVADTVPPEITSITLPADGSISQDVIDGFTVGFSEDMNAAAVTNAANYDLRSAGEDEAFNTADDEVYTLGLGAYESGLTFGIRVTDGPLQPGYYRFTIFSAVTDLLGNRLPMDVVRYFTIEGITHFVIENRDNNQRTNATELVVIENPLGFKAASGRGKLYNENDVDYWSFAAVGGERLLIGLETKDSPRYSRLRYQLEYNDGTTWQQFGVDDVYGSGYSSVVTIPTNGVYRVRVSEYDNYFGEYAFRVFLASPPLELESEANNEVATADALEFRVTGESASANIAGYIGTVGDLDYYDLGAVTNGSTIFLSTRLPSYGILKPVVSVYDAQNGYVPEAPGGRPSDGVAEVRITQTGRYYAVVRGVEGVHGIDTPYILDAQVMPTGAINFPNLQVTEITPPSGSGITSGQPVSYSFAVKNVGSIATPGEAWFDRAVMSINKVLGDADDILLGVFQHQGALEPEQSYNVSGTNVLADGIQGPYYVIVQTDSGNSINEFLLEADNVTVAEDTFNVNLADYPDVRIEDLTVAGPQNNKYTVTWNTANRGAADTGGAFKERLLVKNLTTGNVITNAELIVDESLAVDAVLERSVKVNAIESGEYQVLVIADAEDDLFEYDAVSHAHAENNTVEERFRITEFFDITEDVQPPEGGTVEGAGTYADGTSVTLTAIPNTDELPYRFQNWTENGRFQSAATNYTFLVDRDRHLIANFTLPRYQIGASNNPPAGGTVGGAGTYFHGSTNVLTANPSKGYRFNDWTENGVVVGTDSTLTTIVLSNRFVVANYEEVNTYHVVETKTSPDGIADVTGAGTYTNGQTGEFTAPVAVTNAPTLYSFRSFRMNGNKLGTNPVIRKVFSTADPTNITMLAEYDSSSLLPVVLVATGSVVNPVPATTNYQVTVKFDRTMSQAPEPTVVLSNIVSSGLSRAPTGGVWSASSVTNDTYKTPAIAFGEGAGGEYDVWVSAAEDKDGGVLESTNVLRVVVDVIPPEPPVLGLVSSNSSSATIGWQDYDAPADLNGFRVYLETESFTNAIGLPPVTRLDKQVRTFRFTGLELDREYYAGVVSADNAGNSAPEITPLAFELVSTVPPLVDIEITPLTASSANLEWTDYQTAQLFGFDGFRVFMAPTNFTSVADMTPIAYVGPSEFSMRVDDLDRTSEYFFAVVGVNRKGEFNPTVSAERWADPLSDAVTSDMTIGGEGEPVIDIYGDLVVSNANLTILAGTTLRFEQGAGLTVTNGQLTAEGTALRPIIFTSGADIDGGRPSEGDWAGIRLTQGAGGSVLRHVHVRYGGGLVIDGVSPEIDAFTAVNNIPFGLSLTNGAGLVTGDALISYNAFGVYQSDTAQLSISNSVIKNNSTNAVAAGGVTMEAAHNWWGSADTGEIQDGVFGDVNVGAYLDYEPLLTPAVGTASGETRFGTREIDLLLACRTAEGVRLSEDSRFPGVFFEPFTAVKTFEVSEGGGEKTVFAQFRSITGYTNVPVSLTLEYITGGPEIESFSLDEGQVISRPIIVTATATAMLGVEHIEFYVDGQLQTRIAGGEFSSRWDIRPLSDGTHRVRLSVRGAAGNIAVSEKNVIINPLPPPAPVITEPAANLIVVTDSIDVVGNAEPQVDIRLKRNGLLVSNITVDTNGVFRVTDVPLIEGENRITAIAFDEIGSAGSPVRTVVLDTCAPAAPIMDAPGYRPGKGLDLSWHYAPEGERPSRFQVFWHSAPFATTDEASGNTIVLDDAFYSLRGIADGTYYFGVVGIDAAGNRSQLSNLVSYDHDSSAPTLTVGFNKTMPAGKGPLRVTLTSSEALADNPSFTVTPYGTRSPIMVGLTNSALNTFSGVLQVTEDIPSGQARLNAVARDQAGNVFNGVPAGQQLVVDVTPPTGLIDAQPSGLVQVTNTTDVTVNLLLSEPAKSETTPLMSFTPPVGDAVDVVLSGGGTNWSGILTLTPSMGSGAGLFAFEAEDAVGNVGTNIISGGSIEIYNTALPSPPAKPAGLNATALPGGDVELDWPAVADAEEYVLYRESGSNGAPAVVVLSEIRTNRVVDTPPDDGAYRYAVAAARRGAESALSDHVVVVSDGTPPPAPVNVEVQLVSRGVRISWEQPDDGETPTQYFVYRNDELIRKTGAVAPVIDSPPRGSMDYTVAAVDAVGNENLSAAASIELLVGAVKNLNVLMNAGQPPALSWVSDDPTVVGYNVYRNDVKLNKDLLTSTEFMDVNYSGASFVEYALKAVNGEGDESPARSVNVYRVALDISANSIDGAESKPLVTRYFNSFSVSVTNRTVEGALPLRHIELERVIPPSDGVVFTNELNRTLAGGEGESIEFVYPGTVDATAQTMRVRVVQETDLGGSSVVYQRVIDYTRVEQPGVMISVMANGQPLAGGMAEFEVELFNRGYAPMSFITSRKNGGAPGDLYISVKNESGQEVSRTQFNGAPAGAFFLSNGTVILTIDPGESRRFTVPNVLVPEALASNSKTRFEAVINDIYYHLQQSDESAAGPLSGATESSLVETEYYGTLETEKTGYSNDDTVVITGSAIDRDTGQSVPDAPLKLGFNARGFRWYEDVVTDENGDYRYDFNSPRGFSGNMTLWAAHPLVFDELNQRRITLYKVYANPARGNIKMSKNDMMDFSIKLMNPGDTALTDFVTDYRVYRMEGTNEIPVLKITGSIVPDEGFAVSAGGSETIRLRLTSEIDAPDNAVVEFTFESAEGATAEFIGNLTLLPAIPVLSVAQPKVGYLEASMDRGGLLSRPITVVNSGLRDLKGVVLHPPTNYNWMRVNLPKSPDGQIHMPDIAVGESNTFQVVYTPPADIPMDFYDDTIHITGTNAQAPFKINVYARVTSNQEGAVQFYVDNNLGQKVHNARVRVKNTLLQKELGPVLTDTNGLVTISGLQEGDWYWQVGAPGHSTDAGTVTVVPDQTVQVDSRLSKSVVSIKFEVVPVPYTDRYEIKIEQTFETHVPAPVLIISPLNKEFKNVTPGFEANFMATAKNHGLIEMTDVIIEGQEHKGGMIEPLVKYVPVMRPQESIEVPFRFTYNTNTVGQQSLRRRQVSGGDIADCLVGAAPFGGLANPDVFRGLAAIFNAKYRCVSDAQKRELAKAMGITFALGQLAAAWGSAQEFVVGFIGNALGCIVGNFLGGGGGNGAGGGGPGADGGGGYSVVNLACFSPGTQVTMADGAKVPIEEIRAGAEVSTAESLGGAAEVIAVHAREIEVLQQLRFEADAGDAIELEATPEHWLWVDGKGWTAAADLQTGDYVLDEKGRRLRLVSNRRLTLDEPRMTYSFMLSGDNAFYANGILVHDTCGYPTGMPVNERGGTER